MKCQHCQYSEIPNQVIPRRCMACGTPEVLQPSFHSIAAEAVVEAASAAAKWPPFNSAHEGFAVLAEEVDELWERVKTNQKRRDLVEMRKEAIQVAAMAMRFVHDVTDEVNGRK